jgi:hypothetical protein
MPLLEVKQKHILGILTGIAIILLAALAMINFGMLRETNLSMLGTIGSGGSLQESFGLRLEIILWLGIVFLDLVISLALYAYFKTEKPVLSLFSAGFRFLYTTMLAAGLLLLVQALNGQDGFGLWRTFDDFWGLSLILFGFHLLFLGFMVLGYQGFPKWLAFTILFAGLSYFGQHLVAFLFPTSSENLTTLGMILSIPMMIAELGLAIWFFLPKKTS